MVAGDPQVGLPLRPVLAEVQEPAVCSQVEMSLFTDVENFTTFKPVQFSNTRRRSTGCSLNWSPGAER